MKKLTILMICVAINAAWAIYSTVQAEMWKRRAKEATESLAEGVALGQRVLDMSQKCADMLWEMPIDEIIEVRRTHKKPEVSK